LEMLVVGVEGDGIEIEIENMSLRLLRSLGR
jgi:hypothetical protein